MPDYTAGKARILLEPSARGFFTKAKTALRTDFGSKKLEQDVLLRPVATRFREDADAKLRTLRALEYHVNLRPNIPNRSLFRADAKAQAETHLKGLYATMQVRPELSFKYADSQLAAWRVRQEAKPLKIRVITEHVGGVGRPGGGTIRRDTPLVPDRTFMFGHDVPILKPKVDDREVKQGVEKLKREVERPERQPRISPKIDDRSIKRDFDKFLRDLRPSRLPGPSIRGVELLAPALLSIASEAAPALVTALGDVVGAINEMAGAALAAPGALAVMGTSFTTLALGISGMKDAWKALSQQSSRSENQSTADATKMEKSQQQLSHAIYDQRKAQEDLTKARRDARRELEDLHSEERSSYLSVAEAALDLQKARNELAQPSQGPLDYNEKILRELRAREALSEAIRKQGRAREDVNEADKKGIEGSDRVTQAQESLVRSNEQIADTLKDIKDGGAGAAGAADKVNAAMEKLSPNAAALTKTLFELKDGPINDLAKTASQNLFAGMSDAIKNLVNADLPLLNRGFAGVGSAINRNLLQITKSLNTDQNRGVLEAIFGNTEEFHKRINAAIDPAIRSLGTLAKVGSDKMPALATQFAHLTDRFAAFIDKADKDGRLDKWIDNGIKGVESLARTFGHIVSSLHSVGDAFGGGFLATIERASRKMDDFFKSGRGQNDLLRIAQMTRDAFAQWKPVLQDIPGVIGGVMAGARTAMGGLLPVINVITSTLARWPGIAQAISGGFLAWRGLRPIFSLLEVGLNGANKALLAMTGASVAARGSVGGSMREIAGLMVGVGGSARRAENDTRGSMARMGGAVKSLGTKSVQGLSTALGATASFLGGPWGIAIGAAVVALQGLMTANNDAKEAADEHRRVQDQLASSLDDVTNAAGAATRAMVSKELQDYQPTQGLKGKPGAAAEAVLGPGGEQQLLRAVLPGGQDKASQLAQTFRAQAHDEILAQVSEPAKHWLRSKGFSDENLVDAFLGNQEQVARLQQIQNMKEMKIPLLTSGFSGLGDIKLTGTALNAALASQYLLSHAPALQQGQQAAQHAQELAAGGKPTLKPEAAAGFGPGAEPSYDAGTQTAKVLVHGDLNKDNPDLVKRIKDGGGQVGRFDPFNGTTTVTLGSDQIDQVMNLPAPPSRAAGGPSPEVGMPGPTGGIISELHPGEWVLPRHARNRIGDEWLRQQTGNKAMSAGKPGSYQFGGPVPFLPLSPGPTGPSPGPGPVPPPGAPGLDQGGINVGRTPDNATPAEQGVLNAPGPTVDPNTGQLTSPQAALPNFGDQLTNAFLQPWGFQKDPASGNIVGTSGGVGSGKDGEALDPATYLGKWAGNFGVSLGEALINGVAGFFGLSTDNVYFNAFKQTLGFYSGKLGNVGQQVSPQTQSVVGSAVQGYQTLVDPTTGTQYMIPNDMLSGGGEPAADLGDLAKLPPGKAPEAGLQPNAIKANRAISAAFPEIATIGGVRDDALKWHPEGLALDVMIPGAGGLNDPTPPKAKAEGDKIWAWLQAHADELGVDINSSLWQKPDHFNHIHVAVYGKDNPKPGGDSNETPGAPGGGTAADGAAGPQPLFPGGAPGGKRPGRWWEGMSWPQGGGAAPSGLHPPAVKGLGGFTSELENRRYAAGVDPFTGRLPRDTQSGQIFRGKGGKVYVIQQSAASSRLGGPMGDAPRAAYAGGSPATHNAVWRAFKEAGFPDSQWPALVSILNHESSWNPGISNPSSGAFGLFQFLGHQNDKYAAGYSSDPYTQGKAGMQYIKDRYGNPGAAWSFWQGHNWYDKGGLLEQGVTIMHHEDPKPDVVVPYDQAVAATAALKAAPQPPSYQVPDAKRMAPPPPPEANIPAALPPPGPQAAPVATAPPPPPAAAQPAPTPGPDSGKSYEHPGLKQAVTSGASAAGNIASAVAGAFGGGAGGPLIAGLFAQGGKIANDAINVGAAFASGFLKFGGTTQNPYGVQQRRQDQPPPLAQDNRRVHQGNNYFASMEEWRRQNQLIDAQDMQAGMARIK